MATPARFTSGFTQDMIWQPLGHSGFPNPFFYHEFSDDFDVLNANVYTTTVTTAGTVAGAAGDGGVVQFTTNASTPLATDIASIQVKAAGFAPIQGSSTAPGKKTFFLTRIQVSDAVNAAFITGLIQTTTTPFTPTDGFYFSKATGAANNITFNSAVGSTITSIAVPVGAYTLANNTYIDLGAYNDGKGNVYGYIGSGMVGLVPQSGTGASTPNRGAQVVLAPAAITTALLNPTIAIQSGTTTSKTALADFLLAARER